MQSLQSFHTFGLAVHAKQIVEITSTEQLKTLWAACKMRGEPTLFLGQGSNVLFLKDFNGTVFINRLKGICHQEDEQFHYLHVNGGEAWHELIEWSLAQGVFGLENLALIPGCAGSAPIQNIGAYGVEFKDVCAYVDVLNVNNGEQFRLTHAQCEFGYRESIFKRQYADGYVIVAVGLKLAKNWQPVLKYGSLKELDAATVTAQTVFNEICAVRRSKLPETKQLGNAGSFFKNPSVSAADADALKQEYADMPYFPQADGTVKLAAGWLIEQCGLKGYQIGGAAVHQEQALVLVNTGNATGDDIVELAHHVRQCVALRFDVWLQPEVRFIGENGEVNAEQTIS